MKEDLEKILNDLIKKCSQTQDVSESIKLQKAYTELMNEYKVKKYGN